MADREDPWWAAGFRTSVEELQRLKRATEDKARQAYHDETRALARGVGGLARSMHDDADAAVDKFKAGVAALRTQLPKHVDRVGAAIERGALAAIDPPARFVESSLGLGSSDNPGPGRLVREWRTATGPEVRRLGPASDFTREFVKAPSVKGHVRNAIHDWEDRDGGWEAKGGRYTNYKGTMGPAEYASDLIARNAATNVVGSYALDGEKRGDRLYWTAENTMGLHSLFGGNWTDDANLPTVRDRNRPKPMGSTRQYIEFVTDLDGRPVR